MGVVNTPMRGQLRRDDGDLAGKRGNRVHRDRRDDVDGHVRRLRRRQLDLNLAAIFQTDVHGAIARRRHNPNLVFGDKGRKRGVLRAGDKRGLKRHEVDAHVLAQIAVTRPFDAQHRRKRGVKVDGGGVHVAGRQCLRQRRGIADGDAAAVRGVVRHRDTLCGSNPVRRSVGELEVRRNEVRVRRPGDQCFHRKRHDLGVHANRERVEETAEIGVVADELIPLDRRLCGTKRGIQRQRLAVQIVAGLRAGSTPRVVFEHEDVVAGDVQFVGLTKRHGNRLGEPAHGVGHGRGKDGGNDVAHDAGQQMQEGLLSHEALLLLHEVRVIHGRNLAAHGAVTLRGVQEHLFLRLAVEVGIAHARLSSKLRRVFGAQIAQCAHVVVRLAAVFLHKQTATGNDVGAFFLNVGKLRRIRVENGAVDGIEFDSHSVSHSFQLGNTRTEIVEREAVVRALRERPGADELEVRQPGRGGRSGRGFEQPGVDGKQGVVANCAGNVASTETIDRVVIELDLRVGAGIIRGGGNAERVRADLVNRTSRGIRNHVDVKRVARIHASRGGSGCGSGDHVPSIGVLDRHGSPGGADSGITVAIRQRGAGAQEASRANFALGAGVLEVAGDIGGGVKFMVGDFDFKRRIRNVRHCYFTPFFLVVQELNHRADAAIGRAIVFTGKVPRILRHALFGGLLVGLHNGGGTRGQNSGLNSLIAAPHAVCIDAVRINAILDVGLDLRDDRFLDFIRAVGVEAVKRVFCHIACRLQTTCGFRLAHGFERIGRLFRLFGEFFNLRVRSDDLRGERVASIAGIHAHALVIVEVVGDGSVGFDNALGDNRLVYIVHGIRRSLAVRRKQTDADSVFTFGRRKYGVSVKALVQLGNLLSVQNVQFVHSFSSI
uniref:Uncharacterized protein n=1 Tax=Siphoviridae sp. ctoMB99 TaxID=2826459 RepID=A0A8S5N0I2_9CAUD|nr:MAG TPA: hypothetical protein [Siphoviridae sp. ctoMB99]